MNAIKDFGDTAKALARNPLGIIALFIVLIYGFASLVVGASDKLQPTERYPIVWFLVIFPVIVLCVFAWLVSRHHEKLYAPKDYNTDDGFLRGVQTLTEGRPALYQLDKEIEKKIKEVLISDELVINVNNKTELKQQLLGAANKITKEIRNASFITVDARKLTKSEEDVFELPAGAFSNLSQFTDELYYLLQDHIKPYQYGHAWVLKEPVKNEIIKNARMITNTAPGIPLEDSRSLEEVGIKPGMLLEVVQP